jgi:hypothetical protein
MRAQKPTRRQRMLWMVKKQTAKTSQGLFLDSDISSGGGSAPHSPSGSINLQNGGTSKVQDSHIRKATRWKPPVVKFKKGKSPKQWQRPSDDWDWVFLQDLEYAKATRPDYKRQHALILEMFKCLTHLPNSNSGLRW